MCVHRYHRGGYTIERTRKFYIVEYRILSNVLIKFPEKADGYKIVNVSKSFQLPPDRMYKYHTGSVYDDCDPTIYTNDNAFIYERTQNNTSDSINCSSGAATTNMATAVSANHDSFYGNGGNDGRSVRVSSGIGDSITTSSHNNGSRFYSRQVNIDLENLQFEKNSDVKFLLVVYHPVNVVRISDHLYESYIYKTAVEKYDKQKTSQCSDYIKITALLRYYDSQRNDVSLIFLSELNYFEYDRVLFLSNFIKFKYCNLLKEYIFDPHNYRTLRVVMEIFSETVLFMTTKNLTNISASIQNPLIAFTGERPKTSLTRLRKVNAIHTHQGIRSSQCVNLPMDIGARSTNLEITAKLNRHQELDAVALPLKTNIDNECVNVDDECVSQPVDYFCNLSFIQ